MAQNSVNLVGVSYCFIKSPDFYRQFRQIHQDRPEIDDGKHVGIIFEGVFYASGA